MSAEGQKRIVFHVGGATFHPTAQQAEVIKGWIGERAVCEIYDGAVAFDHLEGCDLLVIMGSYWSGMSEEWAGGMTYRPLNESQKAAFEAYVASGRPLLIHHGGIACYDDWPRFGELLGYTWVWGYSDHLSLGEHNVRVLATGHPLVQGVSDYQIFDEIYYNVKIMAGLQPTVHAIVEWEQQRAPMVMEAVGGRVAGAGRVVYLANGHDLRAFECAALRQLWINSIAWLTESDM